MTNKQAIGILNRIRCSIREDSIEEQALVYVIEVLKTQDRQGIIAGSYLLKGMDKNISSNDTVSRRAAIDHWRAIIDATDESDRYNMGFVNGLEFCISDLSTMPFTQPEIIQCGQCKYAEVADLEDSQDGYTCQFHRGSIWFSGSYCSWAERREE